MAKNGDGEFELVLGNRQLLSVFFIVVILVAVFFTMGYVVGRNSTPGFAEARKSDKAIVADAERKPSAVNPGEQPASQSNPVPPGVPDTAAAKTDRAPAPPPKKVDPEKKPESQGAAPMPEEPVAGQTYVQVVAVQRAEAEIFMDVLGKKGFHAIYAPVPDKPDMFRVLVGPFKDASAIGQARTDLEQAGFKNTIVRKY
jgi:cell division septation protein DedD